MNFEKYPHLERFGTDEVDGIEFGKCYIQPKIDGTNSSCFLKEDGTLGFGSRNRILSLGSDNQGFMATFVNDERLINYFKKYPNHRLFGEFLVPHSLKTYRDDAWNKYYIFDVAKVHENGFERFLSFDEYIEGVQEFKLDYIPVQSIIINPSYEQLIHELEKNTFLIKDGYGLGEGIVIKNYNWENKYGRQTHAKIVRTEFKEMNGRVFGVKTISGETTVEVEVVESLLTEHVIDKVYNKIVEENNGWSSKNIPQLFECIWHEFITEEIWQILKKFKNPTVHFKILKTLCIEKIKKVKKELF